MLPLKRYLYTSFLFALEINIFVLLLLRFCSTRLLRVKACVNKVSMPFSERRLALCFVEEMSDERREGGFLCFRVCMQP